MQSADKTYVPHNRETSLFIRHLRQSYLKSMKIIFLRPIFFGRLSVLNFMTFAILVLSTLPALKLIIYLSVLDLLGSTVFMVKAPCLTEAKKCLDGTVNLGICFLSWKFYIFISEGGEA